jgi:hypothetical protein
MVKVRFENYDSGPVLLRSSVLVLEVPGRAVGERAVVRELPETEAVDRYLASLSRRYRALKISLVDEIKDRGGESAPLSDAGSEPEEDVDSLVNPDMMTREAFASLVASTRKGVSGWWTVLVEGFEMPFKVRGAADDQDAIEMAYKEYEEGV